MAKHAGIARFTYNRGLFTWQALYAEGVKPNAFVLKKFFNNHVKPVCPWIKEAGICQKVTQYAFEHLGRAFSNFFCGKSNYPKFKKKADANFYEFGRQIEYKAQRYGARVVLVDRWYPSTKLCSSCSHKQPMPLSVRVYECSACGLKADRDLNAALNLEQYARVAKPSLGTEG